MANNLPSLDIDFLSVRTILPVRPDYKPYSTNTMFVTSQNGNLGGITLFEYFSTYGVLMPDSIAPYLSNSLISSTYGVTNENISTITNQTMSTLFQSIEGDLYVFAYSTTLSSLNTTLEHALSGISSISSYLITNNSSPGLSSLSTSYMNNAINYSTINGSNISSTYGLLQNFSTGVAGISTLSTNLGVVIEVLLEAINIDGNSALSSFSSGVANTIYVNSAGPGLSSFSTQTWRNFFMTNCAEGLSSLSTAIIQFPLGLTGISSLSTGIAKNLVEINSSQGLSSLSTTVSLSFSSFYTSLIINAPGSSGISSLSTIVMNSISSIASGPGISSLSTSLINIISRGFSTIASGSGLSSISTVVSLGLSSVNFSPQINFLTTNLNILASGPGVSSISTIVANNYKATGLQLSSLSSYIFTTSTADIQYNGFFDFISGPRFLTRLTDLPSLGIGIKPSATLDVSGNSRFLSTVYIVNSALSINKPFDSILNAELDVSGSIIGNNIYVDSQGVFGTTVTAASFLTPSDSSLKDNISNIENAMSTLLRLQGVHFQWKSSHKKDIGLIAQNVKEVLPEAVENGENYLVVAYEKIIPLLLESIKELNNKVERIEKLLV
jgi:hypothetical protein